MSAALLVLHWYRPLTTLNALDRATSQLVGKEQWDIVIAHDLKALEASLALNPTYGVVLDLHEYAPRQEEHSLLWRVLIAPYFRWMCRNKVPQSAAVVTVSQGIVDEYKRVFGFDSTLVVNATPYAEHEPGVVAMPLRLVHSGGVAVQRRLDIMIEGVRQSSADVTLDLFLVGEESALMESLRELAQGDPRIRFREPVPYGELVSTLNGFDVGLSIFPPTTFNLAWCLPNKFFDYVQARLGVVVGPSPEMTRFVKQYGLGVVLEDFEASSLARALEALTVEQVVAWKQASAAHVGELSGEEQGKIWGRIVADMVATTQ